MGMRPLAGDEALGEAAGGFVSFSKLAIGA